MTRLALLSDIHGNADALEKVLRDAQQMGADRLLICGDITGYYYETAAVWQMISEWNAIICRGNHEDILEDWIKGSKETRHAIKQKYGSSYEVATKTLPPHALKEILSLKHPLPCVIDNVRFLLAHGAPWDSNAYIYGNMDATEKERLNSYQKDHDVILMGHTHYQMETGHGSLQIINPGSVGQPRSGKEDLSTNQARAQWALYDTVDRICLLQTSHYDPSCVFEQIDMHDPHIPYLKKVLKRQESTP